MQKTSDKLEIGVLYGLRALMVLFVMNYHIWQQSWISQSVTLFGLHIGFDFWTRSSYLFVDGMILLSGFLLYLPHARQKLEGTSAPTVRRFYFNRLVRIVPSYLFTVLVMLFLVALPQKLYYTPEAMTKDILSHFTFTFLFSKATYVYTPLNVAVWTIAVEMQFYLLFPFIAACMKRRPVLTAGSMMLLGWTYRACVAQFCPDTTIFINQMPAFLDVYAFGMLGAAAYCRIRLWMQKARRRERIAVQSLSLLLFAAGTEILISILKTQSSASLKGHDVLRLSQMAVRLPLAITLLVMMLSAIHWPRIFQKLLDNRLMRFLSTISMNLYIWHQVLAVQMRQAWFPNTDLLHTDKNLQAAYTLLCICAAILAAMAVTFGLEQPVSRWANRKFKVK